MTCPNGFLTPSTFQAAARWGLHPLEFDFDFAHRVGIKHNGTDSFLRLTTTSADTFPLEDYVCFLIIETAATGSVLELNSVYTHT